MANIIKVNFKQNIYQLEECAGCREPLQDHEEYTVIGLPNPSDTVITNIALCDECKNEAAGEGVI